MEPTVSTKRQNYNVGLRFCIALAKAAEERSGEPVSLTDAINEFLLTTDYSKWVEAALLAANAHNDSVGEPHIEPRDFMNMVDRMGFRALADLIAEMWKTFEAVNSQELDAEDGEGEKKSSTGGISTE